MTEENPLVDSFKEIGDRLRVLRTRMSSVSNLGPEASSAIEALNAEVDELRAISGSFDKEQGAKWQSLITRVSAALRHDASKVHLFADGEIDFTKPDLILRLHKKFRIFCVCEFREGEVSPERPKLSTPQKEALVTVTPQRPVPVVTAQVRPISPLRTGGIVRVVPRRPVSVGASMKTQSPAPAIRRSGTPVTAARKPQTSVVATQPRGGSATVTRTAGAPRTTPAVRTVGGPAKPAASSVSTLRTAPRVTAARTTTTTVTAPMNGSSAVGRASSAASTKKALVPVIGLKRAAPAPASIR